MSLLNIYKKIFHFTQRRQSKLYYDTSSHQWNKEKTVSQHTLVQAFLHIASGNAKYYNPHTAEFGNFSTKLHSIYLESQNPTPNNLLKHGLPIIQKCVFTSYSLQHFYNWKELETT